VKSKLYLSGIKNEYRILKEKSENARYELSTFTKLQVERDVIPLYEVIEKHILQQIPEELVGLYHWLSRPKANP
jgi:hypothetical protein